MKKLKLFCIASLLIVFSINSFSAVILTENFTDGPGTYTSGNYTFDSGNTWELVNITGTTDVRYQLNVDAYIISPSVNTVGTISFQYKEGDSGGGTFIVSKSIDGGAFTEIESQAFAGTSFSTFTYDLNDINNNIRIKVSANAGSQLIIDNFEITDYVPGNELITNTPSLSGFNYFEGEGPSTSKFFELSGVLLTGYPGNIFVTAPTNYEVSLNNSTFTNSVNVAFSSATLSTTTIYVRLKSGLGIGTYNQNISITGGGADDIYLSCLGSVTEMPPPAVYVAPSSLAGFSYVFGTGPSNVQTYQLYGNYLIDYPNSISVNAPSHYEISLDNSTFTSSLSVPYDNLNLPSTTIYVRLKSGLSVGIYNSENITNISSSYGTKTVNCSGTVEDLPPDPSLYVTPSTISGLDYIAGSGPSTPQSYLINGVNLTGFPSNISVTAPTNYEVSLSYSSGYNTSLSIPYSSATLSATTIYVRLKSGLSVGDYNAEIITNSGGGATTVNVTCNGTVEDIPPPALVITPLTLNGFTYIEGNGPSNYQSYSISGTYLTGYPDDITISAPTNYEVSLSSGSGYSTSLNIPFTSTNLSNTTIYVRLKSGLSIGTYNSETITNAGGGATTVNVTCSGNVTDVPPPTLSASPTNLSGFTYTEGNGPSAAQSYSLSGSYLTGFPGNITISAPINYEISLSSGSGYTNSLNFPYSSADLSPTTVYVRLKSGLAVGTYNSEFITNSGGGATDADVACNGSVSAVSSDPCLEEDFSGFSAGTHASPNSTDVAGLLDSYTQTSGWAGLKVYQAGGEIKLGSSSAVGYIITPTIDLSAGGTLEFDYAKWTSDNSMVQLFHASDGINFVQIGSDISTTDDFQAHSVEISGGTALSKIKIAGTDRIYLDNIVVYCGGAPSTPILSASPTTLSEFNYIEESGPSNEQNFNLIGSDLDGSDVSITPSTNYEVSLSAISGYQSTPLVLSSYDGSSTTIYVRLKSGLLSGFYNSEIIEITGGGADAISITCNGSVDELPEPTLNITSGTFETFSYIEGFGPSDEQILVFYGTDLDGSDLTITPSANLEISETTGTGFISSPIVLSSYDGSFTNIYVRLIADLTYGTYNTESIVINGAGISETAIPCSGIVDENVFVNEISTSINTEIYPNPVLNIAHLKIENWNTNILYVEIYDLLGKQIYQSQINLVKGYTEETINLSKYHSGIYLIRLSDGQTIKNLRIEKQ